MGSNVQCTEVLFASILSGGFTNMTVINPPEKKLAKRTSVQWSKSGFRRHVWVVIILQKEPSSFGVIFLGCDVKGWQPNLASGIIF